MCAGQLSGTNFSKNSDGAYDVDFLTERANHFSTLAKQWGKSSTSGHYAQEMADSWLQRGSKSALESPQEAAEELYKLACLHVENGVRRTVHDGNLDQSLPWHFGSDYFKYEHDPLVYESGAFLYDACKDASFDTCYSPFLKWTVGTGCACSSHTVDHEIIY